MPHGHSRETGKSTWESRYMTWKDIEMKKYKREEEKERPAPSPWQPLETKNRDGETWGTPIQLYCAGGRPPAMAAVGLPGSRWWEGGDYIQKRGGGKRLRIRFHLSTQYKNNKQAKRNENSLLQQKHYYRSISNCNANVSLSNPVQLR